MAWSDWTKERSAWIAAGAAVLTTTLAVVLPQTIGGSGDGGSTTATIRIDDVRVESTQDRLLVDLALTGQGDIGVVNRLDVVEQTAGGLPCTGSDGYSVDVGTDAVLASAAEDDTALTITMQDAFGESVASRAFVEEGCGRSAGVNLRPQFALEGGQVQMEVALPRALEVHEIDYQLANAGDDEEAAAAAASLPAVGDTVDLFLPYPTTTGSLWLLVSVHTSQGQCAEAAIDLSDPLLAVVPADTIPEYVNLPCRTDGAGD